MKRLFGLLLISSIIFHTSCKEAVPRKILIFSKTEGFRHESIATGIDMFNALGETNGFTVDTTEDASMFNARNLQKYMVIVFLNTTGDVLDGAQQYEFKRYIQAGGGYLGIHAAADTEYKWPWYGRLVGGYFSGHPSNPNVRTASLDKTNNIHISTDHLPQRWERTDEWYNFKSLNPDVTVVLNLDETTYEGGTNGDSHPIAWYHQYDGGRAYYSGGGHTHESYKDENFQQHILSALKWLMEDKASVDYTLPTVMPAENRFTKQVLDSYFNEPMELDILPDGRLVLIERKGLIKVYDPKTETTKTVAEIDVYSGEEDGLIGMAVDPNFAETNHIFLCYSHPTKIHQSVSRFTFDPDVGKDLALTDEKVIITIKTQRDECCHSGGSLEFDHNGNLWGSFGDNTNPFKSKGHSPLDERSSRSPFDAQKSASNTQDLRGKIIRIKVNADGSYDIPNGNLFPKDGSQGRPEIYIMGCRNPYRYSIDPETNYVYWGEIGPDASDDTKGRGPRGYDEVNQAKKSGNFGWPMFIGDNIPYNDWNYATNTSGPLYDPDRPINDSPNNTGSRILPPAQKAMIWYPYAESELFPLTGAGSRNAMAGPVYHSDQYQNSPNRYPDYYDDKLFIYDWMRGWIMAVTFDENGDMKSMEPFLPSTKWHNLMDVLMGPNGDFYTLEYGTGWFTANEDAAISHLTYNSGNRLPKGDIKVNKKVDGIPFLAKFDATGSEDWDGDDLTYTWDFGDGSRGKGAIVEHIYNEAGSYTARVKIKDAQGESTSQIKILAGNNPPEVSISLSGNQQFYFPDQPINYKVLASDKEDGNIDPENISLSVDYIEMGYDMTTIAQGHMDLSQLNSEHPGQVLIASSDCVSCHKVDGTSVGPSYKDVSNKYLSQDGPRLEKVNYLTNKIIAGGGGVWGQVAMSAHPNLKPKDAAKMANYILSLGQDKEIEKLPSSGSYSLTIPKDKKSGGKFVLMASYTDKGANGIKSLRAVDNIILRDANMSAVDFSFIEKASKFTVTKQMIVDLEEEMNILIVSNGGRVEYDNLDLSGLSSVIMNVNAPAMFTGGGSFNIYIDNISSPPIYSDKINTSPLINNIQSFSIPLKGKSGLHKLIATFEGSKEGSPVGTVINWVFLPED